MYVYVCVWLAVVGGCTKWLKGERERDREREREREREIHREIERVA